MNVICAETIGNIIGSVGFLMTLSIVICFFIIVGCLCLRMYERAFPKQDSEKEGTAYTSLNILGRTLKSSPRRS